MTPVCGRRDITYNAFKDFDVDSDGLITHGDIEMVYSVHLVDA